jgi:hypothetical protein
VTAPRLRNPMSGGAAVRACRRNGRASVSLEWQPMVYPARPRLRCGRHRPHSIRRLPGSPEKSGQRGGCWSGPSCTPLLNGHACQLLEDLVRVYAREIGLGHPVTGECDSAYLDLTVIVARKTSPWLRSLPVMMFPLPRWFTTTAVWSPPLHVAIRATCLLLSATIPGPASLNPQPPVSPPLGHRCRCRRGQAPPRGHRTGPPC